MIFKPTQILRATDIESGYGAKMVVQKATIEVLKGEIVLVIGHNGAGKSTLLKTIFGLVPKLAGHISYFRDDLAAWSIRDRLKAGMVYFPQGGGVFTELTVRENVELGADLLPIADHKLRVDSAIQFFPSLRSMMKRRAGTLSGGEQQMVALARSLVLSPQLLLLDEPSLGLAPAVVQELFATIDTIRRESGCSILLVEQKIKAALAIADQVYVLKGGGVVHSGPATGMRNDAALASVYL